MIKIAGRIYKWMIISVVFQLIVVSFFNFIYIPGRGKISVPAIEEVTKPKVDVKFEIPKAALNIKVSFDGLYAGYIIDNKLEIFDVQKKKNIKTISAAGEQLSYYRWLPDRNMIIYSLNSSTAKSGHVQINSYDIDSAEEKKFPEITNLDKNSEVTDIELSPLTNIVYAFIKVGNSQARVYQFDIMNKIRAVIPFSQDTLIKETNYSDKLVYQDSKNKLFVRDGIRSVTWAFPYKNKMVLFDIDNEDKVFVGELNKENNITKIKFGKLTVEPDKAWNTITLKKPVLPNSIMVTRNGVIYEIVDSENAVYTIPDNRKLSYKGKFIEILDDYIVSLDNSELELTVIRSNEGDKKN